MGSKRHANLPGCALTRSFFRGASRWRLSPSPSFTNTVLEVPQSTHELVLPAYHSDPFPQSQSRTCGMPGSSLLTILRNAWKTSLHKPCFLVPPRRPRGVPWLHSLQPWQLWTDRLPAPRGMRKTHFPTCRWLAADTMSECG